MKIIQLEPTVAEIKFDTYRFYLECISNFLTTTYLDWSSLVQQCDNKCKNIKELSSPDMEFIEKNLRLAWNTECLLNSSIDDIDLIRISNQWAPVQAYYAIYSIGEAFAYLVDGNKSGSHKKTLRKITEYFVQTGLTPWNFAFVGPLGKDSKQSLPVNFPKDINIPSNLQRQNVQPIQMIAKCIKAEHSHRVDDQWSKKIGGYKYKYDPGKTSILHFIYRLRIKSNYEEVDLFITKAPEYNIRSFSQSLCHISSWTITYLEVIIAHKMGKTKLINAAREYLKSNHSAKLLSDRIRGYEALL